jgi:hypothetical protein
MQEDNFSFPQDISALCGSYGKDNVHMLFSFLQQAFQTRLTTSTMSLLNEVKQQQNGSRYV